MKIRVTVEVWDGDNLTHSASAMRIGDYECPQYNDLMEAVAEAIPYAAMGGIHPDVIEAYKDGKVIGHGETCL